jgi:hypothetical protein
MQDPFLSSSLRAFERIMPETGTVESFQPSKRGELNLNPQTSDSAAQKMYLKSILRL